MWKRKPIYIWNFGSVIEKKMLSKENTVIVRWGSMFLEFVNNLWYWSWALLISEFGAIKCQTSILSHLYTLRPVSFYQPCWEVGVEASIVFILLFCLLYYNLLDYSAPSNVWTYYARWHRYFASLIETNVSEISCLLCISFCFVIFM